jgi:signal transduction histidine kinase
VQPGTGLGLALTQRLAQAHGGCLWAESAGLRQGSTYLLALPVRPGEP